MKGTYFCVAEDGERFEVIIPEFVLDDGKRRVLH
jgi:ApaG protein